MVMGYGLYRHDETNERAMIGVRVPAHLISTGQEQPAARLARRRARAQGCRGRMDVGRA